MVSGSSPLLEVCCMQFRIGCWNLSIIGLFSISGSAFCRASESGQISFPVGYIFLDYRNFLVQNAVR